MVNNTSDVRCPMSDVFSHHVVRATSANRMLLKKTSDIGHDSNIGHQTVAIPC